VFHWTERPVALTTARTDAHTQTQNTEQKETVSKQN